MEPRSRPSKTGRTLLLLAAALLGACAADVNVPLPAVEMAELVETGEVSPLCGATYEGSLNAHVPLRGVVAKPGDVVTAYVYHQVEEQWQEIGRGVSDELPLAQVDGHLVYDFDLGVACGYGCEMAVPPHAWAGFGPFTARFRLHSEGEGLLSAHAGDSACGGEDPSEILVHALPLPRAHGHSH